MLSAGRNQQGLRDEQVEYCNEAWLVLCGEAPVLMDTSEAGQPDTRTRFSEERNVVILGADPFPGNGVDANSRMSTLACLAHEMAHAERFCAEYRRPIDLPDVLIDEAETNLRASFTSVLSRKDREDLVEDARNRLIDWLAPPQEEVGSEG